MNAVVKVDESPLRIDLGAGKNKKPGFVGVDALKMDGVDVVHDLRVTPWPWADNSVDEAHCSHFLEHLTNLDGKWERVRFFNELYRVLKPGAGCLLVFPYWCSARFYGDPTHKEPLSEWTVLYLDRNWRKANAPHADSEFNPDGYACDYEYTQGYSLNPELATGRTPEYQQFALRYWKESAGDIIATIKKR